MVTKDKYRSILHDEAEKIQWRHGGPPTYDLVNKLFEEGRTKEWPEGSLEETVQNAIKSWEMELSHKIRLQDFKTIVPEKFKLFVNGREGLTAEETLSLGSYNALLKSSLPEDFKPYKANEETIESSHEVFKSAFPRGFAWEVIKVYTGPPEIAFKFRHWGFFEGPFKGHPPTGNMVQFFGLGTLKITGDKDEHVSVDTIRDQGRKGTLKVNDALKVEEVEIYYDPAELLGGLLSNGYSSNKISACPFSN